MKHIALIIGILLILSCCAAYLVLDRNTKEAENRSIALVIRSDVEHYFEKHGTYPSNLGRLERADYYFHKGVAATFEVQGSPPNELITITFPANRQKVVLPIRHR